MPSFQEAIVARQYFMLFLIAIKSMAFLKRLFKLLECAIKLNQTMAVAWNMKNLALFLNGRWEDAVESIEIALQISSLDDEEIAKLLILKASICIFFNVDEALKCIFEVVGMNNQDTNDYKLAIVLFAVIRDEILKGNIKFDDTKIFWSN